MYLMIEPVVTLLSRMSSIIRMESMNKVFTQLTVYKSGTPQELPHTVTESLLRVLNGDKSDNVRHAPVDVKLAYLVRDFGGVTALFCPAHDIWYTCSDLEQIHEQTSCHGDCFWPCDCAVGHQCVILDTGHELRHDSDACIRNEDH